MKVDAQSRIANRPAHQPVLGPTVRQQLVSRQRDDSHLPVILGGTAIALACVTVTFVLARRGLPGVSRV